MQQRNGAQLWGKQGARGALIAGIAAVACCLPAPASAAPASPALAGAVSPAPANGTPTLVDTGTTEQIRQLVDYAVGTFTEIKQGSTTYTRDNAFSFSDTAPFEVTSWDPGVNGTVDTIAFDGSDCSTAYLGGHFSSVGGAAAKNIAAVDATSFGGSNPSPRLTPASNPISPAASPIPIVPLNKVKNAPSTKNWNMMLAFVAPKAFRNPISCVRSATATSIMLIMPIAPSPSVTSPTLPRNAFIASKIFPTWSTVLTVSHSSNESALLASNP